MQSLLQGLTTQVSAALPNASSQLANYFDHSYLADLNQGDYLSYERLAYYQEEKLFTFKCPVPSIIDFFIRPTCIDLAQAYSLQEHQFMTNPKFLERQNTILNIERVFNYIFSGFGSNSRYQQTRQTINGSQMPPSNSGLPDAPYRYYSGSLNLQLKSKSILGLLFITAFLLVLFRLTQRSGLLRQRLASTLSLFWLYCAIQLYLDLNVFQLDVKPLSKMLFLEVVSSMGSGLGNGHSTIYLPEILHLLLVISSFLYFISLVLRFNEILGPQTADELQQTSDIDQLVMEQLQRSQGGQQQQQNTPQIISIDPLSIRSSLEFYHFVVLHVILLLTLAKLILSNQGILFLKMGSAGFGSLNTLDNMEMFPLSPRFLSLFTISFLSFSTFSGRTPIDKAQYIFQKIVPFFIGILHSTCIALKRRHLLLTLDDLMFIIIFINSLCLYLTYESPSAETNNRYPWPFLQSEVAKRRGQIMAQQDERRKNNPPMNQIQDQPYPKNSQLPGEYHLSKEQIDRRQAMIDAALKQRQQEHEEYMRKKEEIQRQKLLNQQYDEYSYGAESPYEEEDIQEQQEKAKNGNSPFKNLSNEAAAKLTQMKLQELILQQLNQLNDESKKILQLGGGLDFSNDAEILQKLSLLATIKAAQQSTEQTATTTAVATGQQVQATQGGQGQQQQQNLKQTAHKMPTKAPSGRPNQRKRR